MKYLRKSYYIILVLLMILIVGLVLTKNQETKTIDEIKRSAKVNLEEGFQSLYCSNYSNCETCSSASGCSWCPESNVCLSSSTLKSTDKNCNQMNTISSSFRCPYIGNSFKPNDNVMYDFSLYKNRIIDKIPPPNLYMSGNINVSNEDIQSDMNSVRNDINNYKIEMPGIIASSVQDQIKPMVKGILSENYYIQGFEDMNVETKCKSYNSCSSCLNDKNCGWDPRRYSCSKKEPNNLWQVTQPLRCVLTASTQSLMLNKPGGNV